MKKTYLALALVLAGCSGVLAEEPAPLPALIKTPGATPPSVIGVLLKPTAGVTVGADGREQSVPLTAADGVGIGPDSSLRWHLGKRFGSQAFLYFLCRTGHWNGYEYVSPRMTYVVKVNGAAIPLEPVAEFAAVRTFQSKDGWGQDMGWIRSTSKVTLKPEDTVTIGCSETAAFVAQCVLVDKQSQQLSQLRERCLMTGTRLNDTDSLLSKISQVFPAVSDQAAFKDARLTLAGQRDQAKALQETINGAVAKLANSEPLDLKPVTRQEKALAQAVERGEANLARQARLALRDVMPGLRSRLAPGNLPANSFDARQADYYRSVGTTYLAAAEACPDQDATINGLRRFATYLWRADQFAVKAGQARGNAKPGMPVANATPAAAEPCERGELLLNGEWEMTTDGTPNAPAGTDWFKIRVPHGPWRETVGKFMALDRKWPEQGHSAWYRVTFPVPATWTAGRLKLRFDAVIQLCEVYVNGQYCGRHIGGFDAFDIDITGAAKRGAPNQLLCFVVDTSATALEKSDRADQPQGCSSGPNHYLISDLWGPRFGGIWQDVSLVVEPAVKVNDVFVITSCRQKTIAVQSELRNGTARPVTVALAQDVLDGDKVVLSLPGQSARLAPGETRKVETRVKWRAPKLWGIGGDWGDPKNLYHLRSRLTLVENPQVAAAAPTAPVDTHLQRFGFREFWIADGQFWLNGKRLPLQGGGNWYLQESKPQHGNRWFGLHNFRSERGMNVNIERWHRQGDIAREFFDLGDELGMLSEPEGAYWNVSGVPDLAGIYDWDDPVWTANLTRHYRDWARKHRNHPSIVLWSLENETFCIPDLPKAMVDRFLAFGRALNEEDPTRPITFHGIASGGYCDQRDDIQIVNLHYPSDAKIKDWKKTWGGRPCLLGEFQDYEILYPMCGPDPAKSAERVERMCKYIEQWTAYHREIKLSGAMFFTPYMVGLFTTADRSLMGPWADVLPDPSKLPAAPEGIAKGCVFFSAKVPISWPSLSGPGIKCEQLLTGSGNLSVINWFDPARPSITPNKAYETLARCWDKMPPLNPERAPEVIVTVTKNGQPLPNTAVIARPVDGQAALPLGVMTDPNGTAWFVLSEPGRYELSCGDAKTVFAAKRLSTTSKPGYDDVPRVALEAK